MTTTNDSDDDLEGDVITVLKTRTGRSAHGAFVTATLIGLEAGFDRHNAARRVAGVLKRLVARGPVETEKSEKPIIYRWKA
jgi:hypothetical protein